MTEGAENAAAGAFARAREACAGAAERLRSADPEALAEYVPPHRVLLIARPATMRPLGEVWRLGSLLLGTDAALYAAGRATRAAERGRPGYQSVSREERQDIAAAALRGGYAEGAPVNFDAVPLPLDGSLVASPELPIGLADGEVRVRWRDGAPLDGAPTLARFLDERVALLLDPPGGA